MRALRALRGISRPLQRALTSWAPATAAVHADAGIDKTSHDGDVAPPIGLSTTFDDGADHVYSRISAPTRQRCEAVLAALEGGEGARAVRGADRPEHQVGRPPPPLASLGPALASPGLSTKAFPLGPSTKPSTRPSSPSSPSYPENALAAP